MNNVAAATLAQNAVSTTVSDARVGPNSVILPMATSANAGLALTTWSVRTQTEGSFVLTHLSTSTNDCTLFYVAFG